MAAFARAAERAAPRVFHLWPEHEPALHLWHLVCTQWREGFGGRTGLDYASVQCVLRDEGLRGKQRRERFAELRVMEFAALAAWAEQRKRKG